MLFILLFMICTKPLLAQQIPSGTSTGICPGTKYTYFTDTGCASGTSGWAISGGFLYQTGTGSLGDYAIVQWNNVSVGQIGTRCGSLTVSINENPTPTIAGPSSYALCEGSMTLTANATANTNAYSWIIEGTGITPSTTVGTTTPQLTISYTNQVSATIRIKSFNPCGAASNASSPITLSPKGTGDLQPFFQNSPYTICTSGTISIASNPANASLTWQSSNPSILSLSNNVGNNVTATRLNNANAFVDVTATLTNSCGSRSNQTQVVVGSPAPSYIYIDASTCPEYYFDVPSIAGSTSYFWQWSKDPYGTIRTKTTPGSSSGRITLVDGSGTYRIAAKATTCGQQSNFTVQTFTMSCGGGGKESKFAVSASPNPASSTLTIQATPAQASPTLLVSPQASFKEIAPMAYNAQLVNGQSTVLKSGTSKDGRVDLDVSDVPMGTYYLHVNNGVETVKSQIVIRH